MRIRIIYALTGVIQPKADWPNVGFDNGPVMENINNALKKQFPEYEFLPVIASGKPEAEKIMLQDKKEKIGGYIVYQMNPGSGSTNCSSIGQTGCLCRFPVRRKWWISDQYFRFSQSSEF